MKVLINTPKFNSLSGGAVALHLLCHMLRSIGIDAYVYIMGNEVIGGVSEIYDTPIANGHIDPKDCVVIYPEGVPGNPLCGKIVVRWLLYYPNVFGIYTPSEQDIIVYYAPDFSIDKDPTKHLCLFDFQSGISNYIGNNIEKSIQTCYTTRKGNSKQKITETQNALEITREYTLSSAIDIMSKSNSFYSYDTATVLSLYASICGCLSVVIPDDNISATHYRINLPMFKYGIAYGNNIEEIEYAQATKHMVYDHLKSIKEEGYRHVQILAHRINRKVSQLK